jgi:hypothetical protein
MLPIESDLDIIAEAFIKYIKAKGYQFKKSKSPDGKEVRLDISNLKERAYITIFDTGTMRVQGKENLKAEFEKLKQEILKNPQALSPKIKEPQACAQTYDIMLESTRDAIKESIKDIGSCMSRTEKY